MSKSFELITIRACDGGGIYWCIEVAEYTTITGSAADLGDAILAIEKNMERYLEK